MSTSSRRTKRRDDTRSTLRVSRKNPLGSGAFGRVYRAELGKLPCAAKVVPVDPKYGIDKPMEAIILKDFGIEGINHSAINIVDNNCYFIGEISDGTLRDIRGKVPEDQIGNYIAQLVISMHSLFCNKIIHGDIKPANILIFNHDNRVEIRLTDFSLTRNSTWNCSSYGGTRPYMAPEMYRKTGGFSYASDVWSMGCTIYELITGEPLMSVEQLKSEKLTINRVQSALREIREKYPKLVHYVDKIVEPMLQYRPENRVKIPMLINHLRLLRPITANIVLHDAVDGDVDTSAVLKFLDLTEKIPPRELAKKIYITAYPNLVLEFRPEVVAFTSGILALKLYYCGIDCTVKRLIDQSEEKFRIERSKFLKCEKSMLMKLRLSPAVTAAL